MPDLVTHFYFAETVLAALPAQTAARIDPKLHGFTSAGPDVWFSIGFTGGRYKPLAGRGGLMHRESTGDYLMALADEARRGADKDALFSYLTGFLCHYCLDSRCHPYIMTVTGSYDGSDATLRYRGAHTRLERAIDSYVIRERYGYTPWRFPFLRRVLRLRALPETLRTGLDAAHERVFGWTGCFDALQRCVRDQRRFYALMKDPCGLLTALARRLDNGHGEYDLPGLTYYRKELAGLDFLNEQHRPWRHFRDPSIVSDASFFDLFELAKADCLTMIEACRTYVYDGGGSPAGVIGDRSYESGFDWRDPRNEAAPQYEPIF